MAKKVEMMIVRINEINKELINRGSDGEYVINIETTGDKEYVRVWFVRKYE